MQVSIVVATVRPTPGDKLMTGAAILVRQFWCLPQALP